jgi:hypothetical protein
MNSNGAYVISEPTFRTLSAAAGVEVLDVGAGELELPHPARVKRLKLSNPVKTRRSLDLNNFYTPLFR